jgi:hypothetical protein
MPRPTWEKVQERNAENARFVAVYKTAQERADQLPVPDIQARGPFSDHKHDLPGHYVINEKEGTITWYISKLPDGQGGWTSGLMVSAYTPENVRKLEEAGYQPGSLTGIHIDDIHADSKAAIQKLLNQAS